MSASEKLKALDPERTLDELIVWINTDVIGWLEVEQRGEAMRLNLQRTWPQIVAVVEAAESEYENSQLVNDEAITLGRALAALEEALS